MSRGDSPFHLLVLQFVILWRCDSAPHCLTIDAVTVAFEGHARGAAFFGLFEFGFIGSHAGPFILLIPVFDFNGHGAAHIFAYITLPSRVHNAAGNVVLSRRDSSLVPNRFVDVGLLFPWENLLLMRLVEGARLGQEVSVNAKIFRAAAIGSSHVLPYAHLGYREIKLIRVCTYCFPIVCF